MVAVARHTAEDAEPSLFSSELTLERLLLASLTPFLQIGFTAPCDFTLFPFMSHCSHNTGLFILNEKKKKNPVILVDFQLQVSKYQATRGSPVLSVPAIELPAVRR